LNRPPQSPFDSVENAHDYIRLLVEAISEAKCEIAADLGAAEHDATELRAAAPARPERRVEALRLVQFKLDKLEQHLQSSSRLLNDLRTLRRLLFEERPETTKTGKDSAA